MQSAVGFEGTPATTIAITYANTQGLHILDREM